MTSRFGRSYLRTTVEGTEFSPRPPDGLIFRFSCVRKAICPYFPPSRRTPPVVFTSPSISPAYAGAGLRRRSSIRRRIFRNSSLGTATSANWNVTYRPWRTTLAPIFTSLDWLCRSSPQRGQRSTSFGKARVRLWLIAEIPSAAHRSPLYLR